MVGTGVVRLVIAHAHTDVVYERDKALAGMLYVSDHGIKASAALKTISEYFVRIFSENASNQPV